MNIINTKLKDTKKCVRLGQKWNTYQFHRMHCKKSGYGVGKHISLHTKYCYLIVITIPVEWKFSTFSQSFWNYSNIYYWFSTDLTTDAK